MRRNRTHHALSSVPRLSSPPQSSVCQADDGGPGMAKVDARLGQKHLHQQPSSAVTILGLLQSSMTLSKNCCCSSNRILTSMKKRSEAALSLTDSEFCSSLGFVLLAAQSTGRQTRRRSRVGIPSRARSPFSISEGFRLFGSHLKSVCHSSALSVFPSSPLLPRFAQSVSQSVS